MQTFATLETTGVLARNDQAFTLVIDVSRTGIGLRTGQPPVVGDRVIVRLGLGEEIRQLKAVVRRVSLRRRGVFDVGLEWHGCTRKELAFVDEFTKAGLTT